MTQKVKEMILEQLFKLSEKVGKIQEDMKKVVTKEELDKRFEEQNQRIDEKIDWLFAEYIRELIKSSMKDWETSQRMYSYVRIFLSL